MQQEKLQALIALAKANHAIEKEKERVVYEAAKAAEYATNSDIAKTYIDKLLEEIEQGSLSGRIHYQITNLPKKDYYVVGSYDSGTQKPDIIPNSVTDLVIKAVKKLDIGGCFFNIETRHSNDDIRKYGRYGMYLSIVL